MRIGVLGLIMSDLTDVTYELVSSAIAMGFRGVGAHITKPAAEIDVEIAVAAAETVRTNGLEFIQLWGPYPSIITTDEDARLQGVEAARDVVRLAAAMGLPAAGVRPTTHSPRGDWWAHPENHTAATEDTFVRSLSEILETAVDLGVNIVLEKHQTTTLDSPERVKRVIERTDPEHVKVNIDTVNFVSDLKTAYNPTPMIDEFFDVLGPHCDSVHVKDFYLEDRFVLHISETIIGTGMMDIDTVLRRAQALGDDTWAMVEHLPVAQIALAKRNLTDRAVALGIPVA